MTTIANLNALLTHPTYEALAALGFARGTILQPDKVDGFLFSPAALVVDSGCAAYLPIFSPELNELQFVEFNLCADGFAPIDPDIAGAVLTLRSWSASRITVADGRYSAADVTDGDVELLSKMRRLFDRILESRGGASENLTMRALVTLSPHRYVWPSGEEIS